jgi:acetyltransferase
LTGVEELLELFDAEHNEDSTPFKILYMEGIKQPGRFLKAARSLSQKGCVLGAIKGGTTGAGSRAAASHTGAMATNDTAVQALLDKAGIIRVQSRPELIDVATVLVCARGKLDGHRVAIVTDAGGPGVLLADELNRQGFEVPAFKQSTREKLNQVLLPGSSSANPVDCLPARNGRMMAQILEIIRTEEAENIDYILCVDGDSHLSDNWEVYQAILREMEHGSIPVFPSFCTIVSSHEALEKFKQAGKCYFDDEVAMARALGAVVNRPRLSEPTLELPGFDRAHLQELLQGQNGTLSASLTRQVLQAAGMRFPGQVELTEVKQLDQVPFAFPWVMKVSGPLHKTDVGGVRLNIGSLVEAEKVWEELLQIPGATGCLVQQMIKGSEVLLGANREEGFGHLVAFGLGGIYTEALKDVHFALAPLSPEEADSLIHSLRALKLIQGTRGEPGMNFTVLQDLLLRISLLVHNFPQIKEMDLNPIKGYGQELYVVDARIIVE